MIAALTIGRAGSTGFKNKNLYPIVGRPLSSYSMMAAKRSRLVDKVYVSTDSPEIAAIGKQHGAEVIMRDPNLATNKALSQDAFKNGYEVIAGLNKPEKIEMMALLFCNGATVTPGIIDQGIEALRANPGLDSAVTVSRYNMWSPLRAHRIADGRLIPFLDPSAFESATCDRDSQGDVHFPDCSAFVVRPRCFDFSYGVPPFPWIGRKVYPLEQWGGLDVDYEWQMPQVEFWLRKHGFTETQTPYDAVLTHS
ncbi:MAG: NTP transferase domain-containing protein [Candidatus Omnitrophica bacterium]|nr:NTP transferase domain-containing protein [Candidatus Omnitrophota bacterium]